MAFLILFLSVAALAAPFKLTQISQTEQPLADVRAPMREQITTYQVDGTGYEMVVRALSSNNVVTVTVFVYNGKDRENIAAQSMCFVNLENGKPVSVSVYKYSKSARVIALGKDDGKGLGELVLQPVLQLKGVKSVTAELGIDNTQEMRTTLRAEGRNAGESQMNEVVMTNSHFGRVMGQYGFDVDPTKTHQDTYREDTSFEFKKLQPKTTLGRRCFELVPAMVERLFKIF